MNARPIEHALALRRLAGLLAALALAAAALLLLSASVSAEGHAAGFSSPASAPSALVITVTSVLDAPDDYVTDTVCHETADGGCSLRAAVQTLDHHSGGTIVLGPHVYTLTDDSDGDLQLQKNIAINGQFFTSQGVAQTSSIQGEPGWTHRILRVQDGANVTLGDLTMAGGNLPAGNGGGIDVVSGTLTLIFATVTSNTASQGGGIYNAGTLSAVGSTISFNHAATYGGGVFNAGTLTASASTLQENLALDGGGLDNVGVASLDQSAILSNVADAHSGGGLFSGYEPALVQIANSTFAGNRSGFQGAGVDDYLGTVRLFNVTVAYNSVLDTNVGGGGGGLHVSDNQTLTLADSLVALNVDQNGVAPDCDGTIDSLGYNLVQSTADCHLADLLDGNISGRDPQLLPLGYYGGSTLALGLAVTSPAVDAGNTALGCRRNLALLTVDQENHPRAVDGNGDGFAVCDIGAYELQLSRLFLPAVRR